ncbi:hypothetical protein NPIL_310931 [Nephila pilipes]|uniref:Uncharacterized protein n=1 Tax=Nephila pilipes TaxID=299642 RepID=A0A8X6QWZ4_NEPPI|nr:hypothetical protein NPIL_310931 [Nephila pilipes]
MADGMNQEFSDMHWKVRPSDGNGNLAQRFSNNGGEETGLQPFTESLSTLAAELDVPPTEYCENVPLPDPKSTTFNEISFTAKDFVNTIMHSCGRWLIPMPVYHGILKNVWAGILGDARIKETYLLQQDLPKLLRSVPAAVQRDVGFMYDGALLPSR